MSYLVPVAIFIFCVPAVFLPSSRLPFIFWLAGAALVIGGLGCGWAYLMPKNFLTDHPWVANTPFHPDLAIFWGGAALLFGFGLLLALASRSLLVYLKILKIK